MGTDELLRVVAAHGLTPHPSPPRRVTPDEVPALVRAATGHKLMGLLDQAVADGLVEGSPEVAEVLAERAVWTASGGLLVEQHLLAVDAVLSDAAVPHRFVKGATVAHRFYAHPGLRMFVDVDVLVPAPHLRAALGALAGSGHERLDPDPAPRFTRRFAKSVTLRAHGVDVDVHRVIADGPFGLRAGADAVWARPEVRFDLGGTSVPTVDPVTAFVQACTNAVASYDRVALGALRDVAEVAGTVADHAEEVSDLAGALGVRPCVVDAVRRTQDQLGWEPPATISALAGWPVTDVEQRWLDSYRRPPSDWERARLGLRAVPGAADRVRYALGVGQLLLGRRARRRARRGGAR